MPVGRLTIGQRKFIVVSWIEAKSIIETRHNFFSKFPFRVPKKAIWALVKLQMEHRCYRQGHAPIPSEDTGLETRIYTPYINGTTSYNKDFVVMTTVS